MIHRTVVSSGSRANMALIPVILRYEYSSELHLNFTADMDAKNFVILIPCSNVFEMHFTARFPSSK